MFGTSTSTLEKVQQQAARLVTSEYNSTSSVIPLLEQLNWKSLQNKSVSRLIVLHKVLHQNLPSIQLPCIISPQRFQPDSSISTDTACQKSYFLELIKQWNNFITNTETLEQFNDYVLNLDLL